MGNFFQSNQQEVMLILNILNECFSNFRKHNYYRNVWSLKIIKNLMKQIELIFINSNG